MHGLPSPHAIHTLLPFASERMRKRRCFADKDLDLAMYEREKSVNDAMLNAPVVAPVAAPAAAAAAPNDAGVNVATMTLQRCFPMLDQKLVQYVYHCCGKDLNATAMQLHEYQRKLMLCRKATNVKAQNRGVVPADSQRTSVEKVACGDAVTSDSKTGAELEPSPNCIEDPTSGNGEPGLAHPLREADQRLAEQATSKITKSNVAALSANRSSPYPPAYMAYCVTHPAVTSLGVQMWYNPLMTLQHYQQQLSYAGVTAHQSASTSLTNHRAGNHAKPDATCEGKRSSPERGASLSEQQRGAAPEQRYGLSKHQMDIDDKPKHSLKFSVEALIGKC